MVHSMTGNLSSEEHEAAMSRIVVLRGNRICRICVYVQRLILTCLLLTELTLACAIFGCRERSVQHLVTTIRNQPYGVSATEGEIKVTSLSQDQDRHFVRIPNVSRLLYVSGFDDSDKLLLRTMDGKLHLADLVHGTLATADGTYFAAAMHGDRLVFTWTEDVRKSPTDFRAYIGTCVIPDSLSDFPAAIKRGRAKGKHIDTGSHVYNVAVNGEHNLAMAALEGGEIKLLCADTLETVNTISEVRTEEFRDCGISDSGDGCFCIDGRGTLTQIEFTESVAKKDGWKWNYMADAYVSGCYIGKTSELLIVRDDGQIHQVSPKSRKVVLKERIPMGGETDSFGDVDFSPIVSGNLVAISTRNGVFMARIVKSE